MALVGKENCNWLGGAGLNEYCKQGREYSPVKCIARAFIFCRGLSIHVDQQYVLLRSSVVDTKLLTIPSNRLSRVSFEVRMIFDICFEVD